MNNGGSESVHIPGATYRIQFTPAFGFRSALQIIPYLKQLGITALYASPVFLPTAGSTHGYDVADPNRFNPDLGTEADFLRLAAALQKRGMGLIQDFAPNHMAYARENALLMDVLENGPASRFFRFFDIQWDHPRKDLRGRILAPFLGKPYVACLEDGDIRLEIDRQGFGFTYYDLRFPLRIDFYKQILEQVPAKLDTCRTGFSGILEALKNIPPQIAVRQRSICRSKDMLWRRYSSDRSVRRRVDAILAGLNGVRGNPGSFRSLDRILSAQFFRFAFWKDAAREINYRRFFSINGLIALRQEEQEVFQHTHRLILRLCTGGSINGLRIDHIDGLYDPSQYLTALRKKAGDVYIVVEKILGEDEPLPAGWPVQGTTGYEFAAAANGILCRSGSRKAFDRLYSRLAGFRKPFCRVLADSKRLVLKSDFSGEVDNLARHLKKIAGADRRARNLTFRELRSALSAVVICFPVYRTYAGLEGPGRQDRRTIRAALNRARENNSHLSAALAFLQKTLLFSPDGKDRGRAAERSHFTMRFQQFTGPVMAKGFEDTALYVYNRLLSLNEVGGRPDRFGVGLRGFHRFNESRLSLQPLSLNATATHDTKRGEDVRARLSVLSEIPEEWERHAALWMRLNNGKKPHVRGKPFPRRNEEYHLYQTLVGAFPFCEEERTVFCERVKNYVVKALREGKVYSSWIEPDEACEAAFKAFVGNILRPAKDNAFLKDFIPFQRMVAHCGMFNSLTQTLLKITAPGVPDFYQGTELWDLSLVDPDNRRPVDFDRRQALLRDIVKEDRADPDGLIASLLRKKENGRIKMFLIARALAARQTRKSLFARGAYQAVRAGGSRKNHVVGFARIWENQCAVVIAPRFLSGLAREGDPLGRRVWGATAIELPDREPRRWRDVFTGRRLETNGRIFAHEALNHFPVSLLLNEDER